jgi:hypothetical protein
MDLIGENTRTIERLTKFVNACTNIITSGDISIMSTCDSVTQKYNIEMGKFQKEKQLVVEDLIYPFTIPTYSEIATNLNSAQVVGSSNAQDFSEHISTAQEYNDILVRILDECASVSRQYDYTEIGKCIEISKSLNEKNRIFNTNAGTEINKVLSLDTSNFEMR